MATQVVMPQLGESVIEGTIGRWLKNIGDTVAEYEGLLEVQSDKVDTEIPSPASGTVLELYVTEGDVVSVGTVIALIGKPGEQPADSPAGEPAPAAAEPTPSPEPVPATAHTSEKHDNGDGQQPRVSPVVANIAAQHRVDVNAVSGTGRGGRVTKKDILAYIEEGSPAAPPAPAAPAAPAPARTPAPADHVHTAPKSAGQPGEIVQLSRMRRLIADHMVMSKLQTAPHVTTVFEVDLSAVVAHRAANKNDFASRGVNLTFTAYFVSALATALRAHPMVNSRWTDEGIFLYPDVNIGMAVAISEGLIVPVIKHVDELSLLGLARQINDLAIRARDGKLQPDEVQGGTFTLTNHGVSGSLFATPIINQPQTGIFGVGAMQKRVVVTDDDAIAIRPMVYVTLTFDHRVLDGATADFFVAEAKRTLENWQ